MPAWQPAYFPEVTFPVHNRGTDECILTRITFEVLSICEREPSAQSAEQPTEKRRDLSYAIIIDLNNPKAPQSFPVSVPISPGETLELLVAVGAKRSARTRFLLYFEYDRRGKTRSAEVELDITNDGKLERWYQPGIALERFHWLRAKSSSDLNMPTGVKPADILRSLILQNRPLNIDYLRTYGPGVAYFFAEDKPPLLPSSGDAPVRLAYSLDGASFL